MILKTIHVKNLKRDNPLKKFFTSWIWVKNLGLNYSFENKKQMPLVFSFRKNMPRIFISELRVDELSKETLRLFINILIK